MNLLVLSDTHGNYPLAFRAIDQVGPVDHIIHLGDGLDDAVIIEDITGIPMSKVAGNCDFSASVASDMTIILGGHSIFATHGHKYGVKSGFSGLWEKAVDTSSSIVLFGHTHLPLIQKVNDVLFVNPGCLSQSCQPTTCAVLSIGAETLTADIVQVV